MSEGEIVIAAICAVLVVFALTVAMVVPRRRPDFPAGRLGVFFLAAAALVVAMLLAVELGGGEEEEAAATPAASTAPATETAAAGSASAGGATESAPAETSAPAGDPAAGKEVFTSAGCVSCHTLAAAGASGTVGPDLDQAKPAYDLVVERVKNGRGAMPPFAGTLSDDQIANVAAYVVQATSGP